jgi:hypothetical protein
MAHSITVATEPGLVLSVGPSVEPIRTSWNGKGDGVAGAHDPLASRLALAALSLAKIWRNCRMRSDSGMGSPSTRPASKVISAARSESVSSMTTINVAAAASLAHTAHLSHLL